MVTSCAVRPPPTGSTRTSSDTSAPSQPSGTRRPSPVTSSKAGTSSVRSSCQICSYSQKHPETKKTVYHDHFSSKHVRELLEVEYSLSGSYFCPSCKSRHSPYPTERTKVVLSDSTLHKFFDPPTPTRVNYKGDILHTDYVTISGATLDTLFHAFKIDYSHHTTPMDIFIVAGYNDLVKNHSREYIVDTIKKFCEYVRQLPNEDNSINTVAVGTLLYPPQLSWFVDNGPEPEHYTNQKEKINWINGMIDQLNIEHGVASYVGVHKHGIRVVTRKWVDKFGQQQVRHIRKHRWEQWREQVRSNMLHLTNERRMVLGKAINEYFINRT